MKELATVRKENDRAAKEYFAANGWDEQGKDSVGMFHYFNPSVEHATLFLYYAVDKLIDREEGSPVRPLKWKAHSTR